MNWEVLFESAQTWNCLTVIHFSHKDKIVHQPFNISYLSCIFFIVNVKTKPLASSSTYFLPLIFSLYGCFACWGYDMSLCLWFSCSFQLNKLAFFSAEPTTCIWVLFVLENVFPPLIFLKFSLSEILVSEYFSFQFADLPKLHKIFLVWFNYSWGNWTHIDSCFTTLSNLYESQVH